MGCPTFKRACRPENPRGEKNRLSPSHLDSEPASAPPETSFAPPPWFRRIVAYGMDFLLLGVLIQLLGIFLPKLYGPEIEKEFQELFLAISHSP